MEIIIFVIALLAFVAIAYNVQAYANPLDGTSAIAMVGTSHNCLGGSTALALGGTSPIRSGGTSH